MISDFALLNINVVNFQHILCIIKFCQLLIKTFDYHFCGDENLCRLIYDEYLKVITLKMYTMMMMLNTMNINLMIKFQLITI